MNRSQLQQHLTLVGVLHLSLSGLILLAILLALGIMLGVGLLAAEQSAFVFLSIVSLFVTGVAAIIVVPGFIGGIGLLRRRPWARWLLIVVGFLNLFNFPFGTAVGAYTLWVLLQPEAEFELSQPVSKFV